MSFLGRQKTVNIIGDGYIKTVQAWTNGIKLLVGEKEEPYAVVYSPLDQDVGAILAAAGIFVSGGVSDVDRFIEDLKKKSEIYVSEVNYQ